MIEHDQSFEDYAKMWGFNTEKKDGFFVSFETHKAWCMYQHGIDVGREESGKAIERLENKCLSMWAGNMKMVISGYCETKQGGAK